MDSISSYGTQTLKSLITFLLSVAFLNSSFSQFEQINFNRFKIDKQPFEYFTTTIFQDSKGFMWFGSLDGLRKYDGNKISVYRFNPDNQNTIGDSRINAISEDNAGNLWIATQNGINRFDPEKETFDRFEDVKDEYGSIRKRSTGKCLFVNNKAWIASYSGLILLDPDKSVYFGETVPPISMK